MFWLDLNKVHVLQIYGAKDLEQVLSGASDSND